MVCFEIRVVRGASGPVRIVLESSFTCEKEAALIHQKVILIWS